MKNIISEEIRIAISKVILDHGYEIKSFELNSLLLSGGDVAIQASIIKASTPKMELHFNELHESLGLKPEWLNKIAYYRNSNIKIIGICPEKYKNSVIILDINNAKIKYKSPSQVIKIYTQQL